MLVLKEIPEPVIEVEIEPGLADDQEMLDIVLSWLAREDPRLRVASAREGGKSVIGGMGEHHLEKVIHRLKQEFKLTVRVGAPQIAYRETITRSAEVDHTYEKQDGAVRHFARVGITFEPLKRGTGLRFESGLADGRLPEEFVLGIEKGCRSAAMHGVGAGFPVTDVKMTLTDGAAREGVSSVTAFEIAGNAAFAEGMVKAGPRILEPVMRVEVIAPEDHLGDVIGDLNGRRGGISSMDRLGDMRLIHAMVPLANMFGYVNTLRSMTQERAQFTIYFDHYDTVPDLGPHDDPSAPAVARKA